MAQNYTQAYNRSQSQRANPYNDQPEDYASQLWQSAFNNTKPGLGGAMGGGAVPGIQPQQPQQPPPVSSFVNQKPSGGLGSGVVQGGLQQGGATGQQPQATPWLPGSFGASGNYSQQAQQSPLALSSGGRFDSRSSPTLPLSGSSPSAQAPATGRYTPPSWVSPTERTAYSVWAPGRGAEVAAQLRALGINVTNSSNDTVEVYADPTQAGQLRVNGAIRVDPIIGPQSQTTDYNPGTPMPGVGGAAGDLTTTISPGNLGWDLQNPQFDTTLPPGETPEGPGVDLQTGQPADLPATPPVYRDEPPAGTTPPGTGGGGRFQGSANPNWFGGFDLSRQYDASSAKGTFMVLAEQSGVDPTAFSKEQSEAWFRQHIQPGLEAAGFEVMDVQGDKAFIRTTENPSGEWIDFVSNAGGGNAQYAWQSDHDAGSPGLGMGSFGGGAGDRPLGVGGAGDTSGVSADQRQNGLWGRTEMPDYAAQIMAWLFGEGQNLYNR